MLFKIEAKHRVKQTKVGSMDNVYANWPVLYLLKTGFWLDQVRCLSKFCAWSSLSSCGKTINYWFSYFLPFTVVNLSFWMDKCKLLNNHLSKTIYNFHYHIPRKTILNNKLIVLCCFLSPKQHHTINLPFWVNIHCFRR